MERFDADDLTAAIEDLSMLEYFPREPGAQAAIMRLLAKMCPHREALRWLVEQHLNRIGKWHGPMELRAVLCRRYRPADGVEAYSQLPGFRGQDCEAEALEQHAQLKAGGTVDRRLEDEMQKLLTGKVM